MKQQLRILLLALSVLASSGCSLYSGVIQSRHWDLNETISDTANEQLLLNIVRLRYDEVPYFLQLASITTSFSTSTSIGASGNIPEGAGNNILGLDAGVAYSESPTVTWSLPDSLEFLGRLHAPMGADQLSVLAQSGLDFPLVFRIGVKKINRLRNLELNVQEGLYIPPSYDEFIEALELIEQLRREDIIDLAYGVYINKVGGDMQRAQMDTRGMAQALNSGVQFMTIENPDVFQMLKLSRPTFVRFAKHSDNDPRVRRLRDLLDLDPQKYSFGLIDTGASSKEALQSALQQLTPSRDDGALPEIVLNNRSVMEVLRFASAYVEVPSADIAAGIVREREVPPAKFLRIRSSQTEPSAAWLKIEREGTWYYISANDLNSRISFTFLRGLFSSVVGEVPGSKPLLTLPVK